MVLFTLPPFPSCFPMLAISAELVDLLDSTEEVWGTQPVGGGMHPLGEMHPSEGLHPSEGYTSRGGCTLWGGCSPQGEWPTPAKPPCSGNVVTLPMG